MKGMLVAFSAVSTSFFWDVDHFLALRGKGPVEDDDSKAQNDSIARANKIFKKTREPIRSIH